MEFQAKVDVTFSKFKVAGCSDSEYLEKRQKIAEIPNSFIRWYGKTASRPGRKLGHVTVLIQTENDQNIEKEANAIADQIESIWYL